MANPSAPTHLEFELEWLISATGLTQPSPFRRLNAIENAIAELVRQWRDPLRQIDPEQEIRMSKATCAAACAWIEADEMAEQETAARLAAYWLAAVRDEGVAEGWVRLLLGDERSPSVLAG